MTAPFEIFLVCPPGLESTLQKEALALEFERARVSVGGVTVHGDWPDVWRANLALRGATRVLVRIAQFRAQHLAQLDKRARRIDWAATLRPEVPVRVEASCRKSKIYHSKAAAQRVETAIAETLGARIDPAADVRVMVRIDHDVVQISLDSSGEPLHKRGWKQAVAKAPMRETLAALFLAECGYDGGEPLVDPMCGSGTFPIEAAQIALGLAPGRLRAFAFEQLASFDPAAVAALRAGRSDARATDVRVYGFDRDAGAVRASADNAERAGVAEIASFARQGVRDLTPPAGPAGLVMVNPPYGARIGDKAALRRLYASLGQVLMNRFSGWRVGLVTSQAGLARATRLPFRSETAPIDHGGLTVRLHQTQALR